MKRDECLKEWTTCVRIILRYYTKNNDESPRNCTIGIWFSEASTYLNCNSVLEKCTEKFIYKVPFTTDIHYHLNVTFTIIMIRMLRLPGKRENRTQLVSVVLGTRKDVKRATLHDKAYKRPGGYAVDFINLQPQEIIVTTTGDERVPRRQKRERTKGVGGNRGTQSATVDCIQRLGRK